MLEGPGMENEGCGPRPGTPVLGAGQWDGESAGGRARPSHHVGHVSIFLFFQIQSKSLKDFRHTQLTLTYSDLCF